MQLLEKNKAIESLKFLIITPWYGEFAGGAEVLARSLATELKNRNFEVEVFATLCSSPFANWWKDDLNKKSEIINDVRVTRFPVNKTGKELYEATIKKIVSSEKLSNIDKENFFKHSIDSDLLVKAVDQYLKKGFQVIVLPYFQALSHSVINTYPNNITSIPCLHDETQLSWQQTEDFLSNSKHIFFNSTSEKDLAIKKYGFKLGKQLVKSCVSGIGVEKSMKINKDNIKMPIKLPKNYFVYLGRKDSGKNVDLLVNWFKYYSKVYDSNAKLVFMGGGDKELIPQDNIFIDMGYVDSDIKENVLSNSKGLINLSTNESFSLVLFEAWLSKIPVIVHKDCNVTKAHVSKANGGVFVNGKYELASSLNYMIDNAENRNVIGNQGYNYTTQNFSWDSVISRIITELT